MKIEASAPSNIALIKYMGKTQTSGNLPANPSLSLTLENLRTFVRIEESNGEDSWSSLPGFEPIQLSETGLNKFLSHFGRLKKMWQIQGHFKIQSANNFPSDCGLASSASSFAALTVATYELARAQRPDLRLSSQELSKISRLGSGSSCRSFFSPWATWADEGAQPIELPAKVEHAVLILESGIKSVSSSQAHVRVTSSALFQGRVERAKVRMEALIQALRGDQWREAFELCWSEFWDMHALFETSQPSFGYMNAKTLQALQVFRSIWAKEGDGPLVTMDAGPNVHVLLRPDQIERADKWLAGFQVLRSWKDRS